jgi:hypothetical protein
MKPMILLLSSALLGQAPPDPVLENVKAAYRREFGMTIEHPAIYNNPESVDCRGEGHLTATAYLKANPGADLLWMYMSRDGATVIRKSQMHILAPPSGTIRVLAVLVRYPETFGDDAIRLWEDAQKQINEEHRAFAAAHGHSAPIVSFENTNLAIDPAEIADPHSNFEIRAAAERHGFSPSNYDIVMAIDMNTRQSAGGLSINLQRSIYVGNWGSWKMPLGAREWSKVAATAYHHEMAHHWGWQHDWAPACGGKEREFAPFIAPPVLFGWN